MPRSSVDRRLPAHSAGAAVFVRARHWPDSRKIPGIGYGWEGAAWVALHMRRAGIYPRDRHLDAAIERRLARVPDHSSGGCAIGRGGRVCVAAVAGRSASSVESEVDVWLARARVGPEHDLMLGGAGVLVGAAEIYSFGYRVHMDAIRSIHTQVVATALNEVTRHGRGERIVLGLAHGVAGYLLALQLSQSTFALEFSDELRDSLIDILLEEAFWGDAEALWPSHAGRADITLHGWCAGGPGIGLAALAGFALTGHERYWELAEPALLGAASLQNSAPGFCCGYVGRAQILLEAYRLTGQTRFASMARQVASEGERVPQTRTHARSFFRGRLGVHYLTARMTHPTLPLPGLGSLSQVSTIREVPHQNSE